MDRRTFAHVAWIVAVVAALGLTQKCAAKPPDLPINTDHTVTPDFLPDSDWDGVAHVPMDRLVAAGGTEELAVTQCCERQTLFPPGRPIRHSGKFP